MSEITGHTAYIKWQRPSRPNGDTIGYVATVIDDNKQNCVGVYKISCSNCNTTVSNEMIFVSYV